MKEGGVVLYPQFQGFEIALDAVRIGGWYRRECWPDGEWIASSRMCTEGVLGREFVHPFIVKRTQQGLSPWLPTNDDLFAEDWVEAPQ